MFRQGSAEDTQQRDHDGRQCLGRRWRQRTHSGGTGPRPDPRIAGQGGVRPPRQHPRGRWDGYQVSHDGGGAATTRRPSPKQQQVEQRFSTPLSKGPRCHIPFSKKLSIVRLRGVLRHPRTTAPRHLGTARVEERGHLHGRRRDLLRDPTPVLHHPRRRTHAGVSAGIGTLCLRCRSVGIGRGGHGECAGGGGAAVEGVCGGGGMFVRDHVDKSDGGGGEDAVGDVDEGEGSWQVFLG
mmetsp:Transcript_10645/g.19239  ORF Transcript_10645/g.19239 Transcript_10645/m.19239 type:complete len:238 (+) Transcript_10645:1236-1949(+)